MKKLIRIKLCIPSYRSGDYFYGCINGQEYDVFNNTADEYVTKEKLNNGCNTFILKRDCIVIDNYELPKELFEI